MTANSTYCEANLRSDYQESVECGKTRVLMMSVFRVFSGRIPGSGRDHGATGGASKISGILEPVLLAIKRAYFFEIF
jgi:hypothetical protein